MTILESILTALFCMMVVFIVLIGLYAVVKLFSFLIRLIEPAQQKPAQ